VTITRQSLDFTLTVLVTYYSDGTKTRQHFRTMVPGGAAERAYRRLYAEHMETP